jgi:hypothetical protein
MKEFTIKLNEEDIFNKEEIETLIALLEVGSNIDIDKIRERATQIVDEDPRMKLFTELRDLVKATVIESGDETIMADFNNLSIPQDREAMIEDIMKDDIERMKVLQNLLTKARVYKFEFQEYIK